MYSRFRLSDAVRLLAMLWALMAACAAVGQTTRSEGGADWLDRQLRDDLSRQLSTPAGEDPLATHPFHFVFLVDASQASWKSAYVEFTRSTIERFLEHRLAKQKAGEQDLVSIYPYQLEPYGDEERSAAGLPLTQANVGVIVSKVPKATIPVRGDGATPMPKRGGHDHVGSRRDVLEKLVKNDPARPTVLIQFSSIEVNELPQDPNLDRQRRPVSARTGLLEGTGFRSVPTTGLPLKTDAPGGAQQPFDVYIWITVPQSFTGIGTIAPPPPPAPSMGWLLPTLIVLALAVAAFVAFRVMTKPAMVTLSAGTNKVFSRPIRPGQRFELWGPQSTPPAANAVALPSSVAPGMPAQRLARISVMPGGRARLEPDLCDVTAPGHPGGPITVEKNRKAGFQLTRGNQKTLMMHLHVQ